MKNRKEQRSAPEGKLVSLRPLWVCKIAENKYPRNISPPTPRPVRPPPFHKLLQVPHFTFWNSDRNDTFRMMARRMQQRSMSVSMSVSMPIILMMISPTHDTSSIYDRVHLIIDAFVISNAVIIDVVFDEDRSAMYRRGFGGV